MVDFNPDVLLMAKNVKELFQSRDEDDQIDQQSTKSAAYKTHAFGKGSRKTENKKMGHMDTVNNNQNKFGAVLLIFDKIYVKTECVTRAKED